MGCHLDTRYTCSAAFLVGLTIAEIASLVRYDSYRVGTLTIYSLLAQKCTKGITVVYDLPPYMLWEWVVRVFSARESEHLDFEWHRFLFHKDDI